MERSAFLIFLVLFGIGLLHLGQGISGYVVLYLNSSDTATSAFYVVYILIGIVLILMALFYRGMINTIKKVF